ncbi:hypothetical protein FACS1894103_1990 [Campylobacterota bacterium]|nr:hypothetical protein FACS1894103_1990 [Campylobacterota bacterium]
MSTVALNMRVDRNDKELFAQITNALGTTPAKAIKTFIHAFIDKGGFPFDVSREYTYELKGEALESYNEIMEEIERGTAKEYPNMQALYDELGL